MKTAAMTLALTLGLSALNTLAQDENGPRKRDEGPPRQDRKEFQREEQERRVERAPAKEGERGKPAEARPDQQQWRERVERWQQFAPRGPGLRGGGRGQGFTPPWLGRGGAQRPDGVCPGCGRPQGPLGLRGRMGGGPGFGRGGQGPGFGPPAFAPGRGMQGRGGAGPMFRGPGGRFGQQDSDLGPRQGRGPGFGPPALRGDREQSGPPQDEFRQPRPGPGGPGGPEGRFERGGPGPRFGGRGPANRPPMDRDER